MKQCLESIVNQSYSNLEIILVNDGSTDLSLSICKEYSLADKRIQIIDQKNQGLSAARNSGIKLATGTYIVFVDSDDWINLETINLVVSRIVTNAVDVFLFSYIKEFENKSEPKNLFSTDILFENKETKKLYRRFFGLFENELADPSDADSIVTAWGKMYKTDIIKSNHLIFEDCKLIGTEDLLFNIQYFQYVETAFYLHKNLYHYRKNNALSLTSSYKKNLQDQWRILFDKISLVVDNQNTEIQQAFRNRISLSIIGLGLNELSSSLSFSEKLKKCRQILHDPRHINALSTLQLSYFPLHWKIFFWFAKIRFTFGYYIMLKGIHFMINKKN